MNLLEFVKYCIESNSLLLSSHYIGNNRANNSGDALECFIKDGFSNSFIVEDEAIRLKNYNKYFSYLGNKNNPPDLILKNSDAIEIKKIESNNSSLALNSSYPKNKLYANSPMLTKACKECENWSVKDILYAIGNVNKNTLNTLWLVYGDCFAADKSIYERIKNKITRTTTEITNIELAETNEQ